MSGGSAKATLARARELIVQVFAASYQLVDAELVREKSGLVLRIFVDKVGGISVEDCADLSGEIGDLLDAKNVIDGPYNLEVSSPGLDRRVRDPVDFDRFAGKSIKIRTVQAMDGRKVFSGVLKGMEGGSVAVEIDGVVFKVPLDNIEKANLKHDWDEGKGKNIPRRKE